MTSSLELPRFISQQHHHHHLGEWMLSLALILWTVKHCSTTRLNGEVKKYKHLYFAELQWDGLAKYNSRNSSSTSSSEFVLIWSDLIQPADEQSQPGAGRSKRKPNRTFELTHIAVLWSYSLCGAINIWQEKHFLRYFSVIFKYIWY